MSKIFLLSILILIICVVSAHQVRDPQSQPHSSHPIRDVPPEANMNFTQYAQYYDYPVETHKITTADGYILTYFRIQAKFSTIQSGLPVIYLQHGLFDSSDDWLINVEANAPGFMLANRGYDVWLGNNRGNKYSLEHETLNPNDAAFWQFTWQHFSLYDIPAAFEYIYQQTNQMINYMGHSEGTTQMFGTLALQNPTVLQYLRTFCALGPVAFVNHQTCELMTVLAGSSFGTILQDFQVESVLEPDWLSTRSGELFCELFNFACADMVQFIMDTNTTVDDMSRMDIFEGHFPCGTSTLNVLHWKQMVQESSYVFQMYDYGTAGNLQNYNQTTPPVFNLGNINVPVHLFVGEYDRLADVVDATQLKGALTGSPNVTYWLYPYGHGTFMLGYNMTYMNDVFNILADDTIQGLNY